MTKVVGAAGAGFSTSVGGVDVTAGMGLSATVEELGVTTGTGSLEAEGAELGATGCGVGDWTVVEVEELLGRIAGQAQAKEETPIARRTVVVFIVIAKGDTTMN